jgi:hypothetical protein
VIATIGSMKVLQLIVAIEAAMLAVVVALVLHSERHTRFAPSVAVTTPVQSTRAVLPVAVDFGARGSTKTAALQRGGRAVSFAASNGDSGLVGFKRASGKRLARTR